MNNYCIKVKRRGFNYYTDYMERYFEKVAVQYGYHLTKRQEQAELWCITFISEPSRGGEKWGSKWITFVSGLFNDITYEKLVELSRIVGEGFKSESAVDVIDEGLLELIQEIALLYEGKGQFKASSLYEIIDKYGTPYAWYFSKEHSAFDEPIYVTGMETKFRIVQHDIYCVPSRSFSLRVMNMGGASKGLTLNISFILNNDVGIENLTLIIPNVKSHIPPQRISVGTERMDIDNRTVFHAELSEYMIQAGFNEYSAKLSGRKKQDVSDNCSIWIVFHPRGDEATLKSLEIEVVPNEYPKTKVIYKHK